MLGELLSLLKPQIEPCLVIVGHSSRTWYADESLLHQILSAITAENPSLLLFAVSNNRPFNRLVRGYCEITGAHLDLCDVEVMKKLLHQHAHALLAFPAEDHPPYPPDEPKKAKARRLYPIDTASPLVIEAAMTIHVPIFAFDREGNGRLE